MLADFSYIIRGLPWTVALTVSALAVGTVLGLILMLMRRSKFWPLRLLAVAYINLVRGIPPLVWLFVIFFGLGTGTITISPFMAALTGFGMIAGANMAEIFRGGMMAVHHGQFEAAEALNLNRYHAFKDVIAPQMLRVSLPSAASYAIGLLKDSAIASAIGVTELAYQGSQLSQMTFRGLEVFAVVALLYILLSLPVAWLSRTADLYLRAKVAR
ncbi:amino acid ABC transporter permease [Pseudochrobactrum sp. sp1633]|uniref:amino acid ABC transporter permease n=1 Tax=Pseudochrobactrum sp. sp1633 TaxID=3036706 RepID=UPI0025A570C5|nr:amino acid ABC transporter permease [Pseudochrobactrum sp. sp1633]MDM8344135.1 amino acid ABC transporter permease [Pseudochrobactrum sp. sp1633]HWD12109.1 amino acid ABC transporter permease [Pseudochrobactrum sp.]